MVLSADQAAYSFRRSYFFFLLVLFLGARCESALPAAFLLFLEVLLSRRTFEAALAAAFPVLRCFAIVISVIGFLNITDGYMCANRMPGFEIGFKTLIMGINT